jgi:hypothetical protein
MVSLTFYGGVNEIGGNKILLVYNFKCSFGADFKWCGLVLAKYF